MSFILDALRKSDHARQRGLAPGSSAPPVTRRESRLGLVLTVLGVLLAVNVGVLVVLLLRHPASQAAPSGAPLAVPPVAPRTPLPGRRVLGWELAPQRGTSAPPHPASPPAATTAAAPAAEPAPALSEALPGLAPLSIDLHVYAEDPARRFVIVNGRRFGEGGVPAQGAVIESITPDGAVLNYRGSRYLLPRH